MPNTIILKKSSIGDKIPLTTDLVYGELALNYTDGRLYYKKSNNLIDLIGNGGTITNALIISTSTNAISTTTGALQVSGGVGIGTDLYVGGTINAGSIIINGSPFLATSGVLDFGTFDNPVEFTLDMGSF